MGRCRSRDCQSETDIRRLRIATTSVVCGYPVPQMRERWPPRADYSGPLSVRYHMFSELPWTPRWPPGWTLSDLCDIFHIL